MTTYLKMLQTITPVQFAGGRNTFTDGSEGPGPTIGQGKSELELDDQHRFIAITLSLNGVRTTRVVPMTNVAQFELQAVPAKKEEKPQAQVKK